MARGRPRKIRSPEPATQEPAKLEHRVYKSVADIVDMMAAYQVAANGRVRGLFEDCKGDIYRVFALDYNDKQVRELRANGCSDRIYNEWRARFERTFGQIEAL